jgi:hypothetical protein
VSGTRQHAVEVARVRRQCLEAVLEDAAELKSEQNLRAQDEYARLVQRRLDLLAKLHRLPNRAARNPAASLP